MLIKGMGHFLNRRLPYIFLSHLILSNLGLWREEGSDEFQWHDPDCIVDYLNWDTGSPSVAEANPACTVFRISDGKWRDKNCNAAKEAHQYICQFGE